MWKTCRVAALAAGIIGLVAVGPALAEPAWLGVELQEVDPDLREALDLYVDEGVLIAGIAPDSPAEEIGLEEGDVILSIAGEAVRSVRGVRRAIRGLEPGDEVTIEIRRDGETMTVNPVLDEADPDLWTRFGPTAPHRVRPPHPPRTHVWSMPDIRIPDLDLTPLHRLGAYFSRPRLGVETRRLDEDLAAYFDVAAGQGVLVLEVIEDTPADEVGIRPGDVIVAVDGETVTSPGDLRDLLLDSEGETVSLDIRRRGSALQLTVELDEPDEHSLGRLLRVESADSEELRGELETLRRELDALRDEVEALRQSN